MEDFRSELEKFAGRPISTADLARSIDIFDTNRRLMRTIFENRRSGDAALTSAQLQVLVKSSINRNCWNSSRT
ncbi:2-hydroxyacyl-CoA dehydratase family protein, partial [Escherichia coli]|nr:2-hydroxyacyl-CoA dehydratase family protein [Escherichia coli]